MHWRKETWEIDGIMIKRTKRNVARVSHRAETLVFKEGWEVLLVSEHGCLWAWESLKGAEIQPQRPRCGEKGGMVKLVVKGLPKRVALLISAAAVSGRTVVARMKLCPDVSQEPIQANSP